jgi:hypothetical protein
MDLLHSRGPDSSICPSEEAQYLANSKI